jgi:hypothetical protein
MGPSARVSREEVRKRGLSEKSKMKNEKEGKSRAGGNIRLAGRAGRSGHQFFLAGSAVWKDCPLRPIAEGLIGQRGTYRRFRDMPRGNGGNIYGRSWVKPGLARYETGWEEMALSLHGEEGTMRARVRGGVG